ncbi:hypothetical protein TELCIR_03598 [Teladorsagia circumcincta]|uniref:Endonuclease/exonuclease/phosphatase domain-containing protein n=1 Tax=Teladorsagia circumcincta TaxID=45464 RepID=A0A2G9UVZ8_TELCI|nr:hypothetical protein TELCIR_03598 [Teladorsagia circumcincta]
MHMERRYAIFLGARESGSTSGGIGFIVAPGFTKYVTNVTFYGHRLGVLTATLTKDISISIIQVYAPMCGCSEEQHQDFYGDLGELIRSQKSSYVVVFGDFNARIGSRMQGERFIGPNSAEPRNAAGERLANFCETASGNYTEYRSNANDDERYKPGNDGRHQWRL